MIRSALHAMTGHVGVVLGFMALAAPLLFTMMPRVDELTYLSHGLRQLSGAVIYRDFFEFSTPLSSWLAAVILWLGGASLLAARGFQLVVMGLIGWMLYLAGRRLGLGPAFALMPGGVLMLCQLRVFPVFSHHWIVLPFIWGGLLLAMRGLESAQWRWWVFAGACGGLALLTMQTDGVGLLVTLGLGAAIATRLAGESWRLAAKRVAGLMVGGLVPVALAVGYLAWHGALGAAYEHVWAWPLQFYRQAGGVNDIKYLMDLGRHNLTFPAATVSLPLWYGKLYHVALMYLLPPLAAIGALAWAAGLVWRRTVTGQVPDRREGAIGLVAVAAVVFMGVATKGRADYTHAAFYATPAVLLACVWAAGLLRGLTSPEHVVVRWLPATVLGLFVLSGVMMTASDLRSLGPLSKSLWRVEERITSGSAYRFLNAHAQSGDRIVSLPAGGYHYFFALPPATRFTLLFPPEAGYNSAEDLHRVEDEIRRHKPRFVLLSRQFLSPKWASYLQAGLIDYEPVAGEFQTPGLGPTRIYRRKSGT